MRIKTIKPGHITNCPWCKTNGDRVVAVWHLTGENKQACDVHLIELKQIQTLAIAEDGGYQDYSEADYQSWMRVL